MNLVCFTKKWLDVVGEIMWSVGSYVGALGDDPLHPISLFYYFKNQGETTTPFFQLHWLAKLKKGSSGLPLVAFFLFQEFSFFTISARGPFSGPTDGLGKLGICALERARFFL